MMRASGNYPWNLFVELLVHLGLNEALFLLSPIFRLDCTLHGIEEDKSKYFLSTRMFTPVVNEKE